MAVPGLILIALACLNRQGHRQIFDGPVCTDWTIVNSGMACSSGQVIVEAGMANPLVGTSSTLWPSAERRVTAD